MKKVFLLAIALLLVSCNTEQMKYGQGGKNACQYVKEQVPGLREDIAKVEVIEEDSLLTDIGLTFADMRLSQSESDYYQGKISRKKLDAIIDSVSEAIKDVQYSWQFSNVVNDSLRQLKKFEYQWRKVYKVKVTMKSGDTKEPRVLMDQDGVTPRCLEKDFEKSLQEHIDNMMGVVNRLIYGI